MKKLLIGLMVLFSVVFVNKVAIHRENVIYLDEDNQVFIKGENRNGQLGDGSFDESDTFINITDNFDLAGSEFIKSVSLGEYHGAALSNTGRVFTWGHNAYGKLGVEPGSDENMLME